MFKTSEAERAYNRQYFLKHKEERKIISRRYYLKHKEEMALRNYKYYAEHKEEYKFYHKQYRLEHKEEIELCRKRYLLEHKDEMKLYSNQYTLNHKKEKSKYNKIYFNQLKIEVLTHYGHNKLACVICGENRIDCLSIDHINGDGWKDKNTSHRGGYNLYRKLRRDNYPIGFQTLCMNCQFIKRPSEPWVNKIT